MASISRACSRRLPGLVVLLTSLATCLPAQAAFSVNEVRADLGLKALQLEGSLDLGLSAKAEEALSKGIPLDVVFDLRLYRVRSSLWNLRVGEWQLRRRIRYHALSSQYLVSNLKPVSAGTTETLQESFTSLQEALKYMGTLDNQAFLLQQNAAISRDHEVMVRAWLDLETLPSPLQPVAYTTPSWHLNSGWTTWSVQH